MYIIYLFLLHGCIYFINCYFYLFMCFELRTYFNIFLVIEYVTFQPSVQEDENGESKIIYDERLVTQLNQSYRSHPDIIAIPSKLFYHSTLKAALPQEVSKAQVENVRFLDIFQTQNIQENYASFL